jgi:tRNA (guanine37-N1)-methyltransferase
VRLDVVTIFPEYLAPLRLSLPGKAQDAGLLDVHVHDLRTWTHDRHRTVDDTPYGGGAGMVMKPEPWGEALDALVPEGDGAVLVVPTPSGEPFTQRLAAELSGADRLVIACGRYEGIDERVLDHARGRMHVREISIGDYVLNGGEVAALVVTEAVVRLLPGFMGNPESLLEESHGESRLLEYPTYTKPVTWRGHDVPPVLLSGDHARIAAWRHDQAVRRTAARRPDLLHPAQAVTVAHLQRTEVRIATTADAGEILSLQLACWVSEALANGTMDIPPLHEDLDAVVASLDRWTTFVLRYAERLIGSVRGRMYDETWDVGRLMVAPDLRGRGLGRWLLEYVESAAPPEARRITLFTGARSNENLRLYRRAGYRPGAEQPDPGVVRMSKPIRVG